MATGSILGWWRTGTGPPFGRFHLSERLGRSGDRATTLDAMGGTTDTTSSADTTDTTDGASGAHGAGGTDSGRPRPSWERAEDALAHAVEVLRTPRPGMLPRLSEVLADLVPHTAAAQLSGVCTYSPTITSGPADLAGRITALELAHLAESVEPGRPWQGEAVLAGRPRPAVAVAAAPAGTSGALLVLVREATEPPGAAPGARRRPGRDARPAPLPAPPSAPLPGRTLAVLQRFWELVTIHSHHRATDAAPVHAAASRASAGARARAIAELSGAHASALTAILAPLRSTALDDATARRSATELAVDALLDLRAGAELDRELSEEPAATAFARLADELRPLLRHSPVRLDLLPPAAGERSVPADTAHTARAAVRSAVLVMLEQDALTRLHVSWQCTADSVRAVVRDDGPGLLAPDALAVHRTTDRVTALAGRLTVEPVPGWGTTVTVDLPLHLPTAPVAVDPLAALQPRELDVLDQLARGRRNREIAGALHISESTVKFHVANILAKLDVTSRGAAAALAHRAGMPSSPTLHAAS
ncbi:LuxR C-terminal-related transcriptional regulator [Kitasatospora sp. CM 4170]|uniref:LuxR C-terminal-related transcriptional regulator n=1 Tax=Kitasatospora aburaviensis TaxID=67265 RepID=A0ABW1EPC7_9ACTN|nr:LuxR C-terminal-related transcriptional regulator [Kitasatospora sp. CM 4170]WNM48417.1 LuxR C-terminal-related transcriptional regulator [Kitasatospora sp. CM 4170]